MQEVLNYQPPKLRNPKRIRFAHKMSRPMSENLAVSLCNSPYRSAFDSKFRLTIMKIYLALLGMDLYGDRY